MIWAYTFYLLSALSAIGLSMFWLRWWRGRPVRRVEGALPEVLEAAASMLKRGYSMERVLSELYKGGPPPVRPYLKEVSREVKRGLGLSQALVSSLGELKGSPFISLAIDIMAKGVERGPSIAPLLERLADHYREILILEEERRKGVVKVAMINLALMPIMLGALSTVLKLSAGPALQFFTDMFKLYGIVAGFVAISLTYFLSKGDRAALMLFPLGALLGFAPIYLILEVF